MDLWVSLGNISSLLVSAVYSKGEKRRDAPKLSSSQPTSQRNILAVEAKAARPALLEYEICMDHKEHMDHPSQYPLAQNL